MPVDSFAIGARAVEPGTRATIDLPMGVLSDHTPINMAVHVMHGRRAGPVAFVCAGIHGDEVMGVEIVRRLIATLDVGRIRGTLLLVPIVNAFGFIGRSRYLPDRRDLNRSFPGSADGSLAGRLARLFLNEVVVRASFGIDLHSAAIHRTNLPQIRVSPGNERTLAMAQTFGAPVVLTSNLRDGSLRGAAADRGVDVLLYEAGEGLRFDETAVRTGVGGVLRTLKGEGMLTGRVPKPPKAAPVRAGGSKWMRAPHAGLVRLIVGIGDVVARGDRLAVVADPFGDREEDVRAPFAGIVVGAATLPVVNAGDALFHVARVDTLAAEAAVGGMEEVADDPIYDEDAQDF